MAGKRKRLFWYCVAIFLVVFFPSNVVAQDLVFSPGETIQTITYGKVKGIPGENGKSLAWLGIPYAKPPVGELRWRLPQKPEAWNDVFDATKYGNIGIQGVGENIQGSEDCLNLNVFRPNTKETALPVIMFIHGGNNQTGSNRSFNGYYLAERANCVVVSINYRLGLLGFNPLPALKTGNALEDSGNYSLLDFASALDWINENIQAFGGDPKNITISGHSAGGRDVMALLISPVFEGKFQKALPLSGGMTTAETAKATKVVAGRLVPYVRQDGVKPDRDSAFRWLQTSGKDVRDYLYGLPAGRVASAIGDAAIRMSVFPHLFTDGVVLPEKGFETDKFNHVPLLMLTSINELSLFLMGDPYFAANVKNEKILTDPEIKAEYKFAAKYGGLLYGLFNAEESAERMFAKYKAPIYTCMINWGDDPNIVGEKMAGTYGSFHGVAIQFLTGEKTGPRELYPEIYETPGAREMGETLIKYIANFIRTGNPNGDGLVTWDAWKSATEGNTSLVFDADKEKAIIKMTDNRIIYENVIADAEKDTSIPYEARFAIISNVINGRWFSTKWDEYFKNRNLWP
ncbi:MAG: carboxylesterase family protein [Tannerellaceae bacterium]|nr:carboxylesterase family protein [Tannerellaceae bacterium]